MLLLVYGYGNNDSNKNKTSGKQKMTISNHAIFNKPDWTLCDLEVDMSDSYEDACDPENEFGFEVIGYFHCDNFSGLCRLEGISIRSPEAITYHERGCAAEYIGWPAIERNDDVATVTYWECL